MKSTPVAIALCFALAGCSGEHTSTPMMLVLDAAPWDAGADTRADQVADAQGELGPDGPALDAGPDAADAPEAWGDGPADTAPDQADAAEDQGQPDAPGDGPADASSEPLPPACAAPSPEGTTCNPECPAIPGYTSGGLGCGTPEGCAPSLSPSSKHPDVSLLLPAVGPIYATNPCALCTHAVRGSLTMEPWPDPGCIRYTSDGHRGFRTSTQPLYCPNPIKVTCLQTSEQVSMLEPQFAPAGWIRAQWSPGTCPTVDCSP